MGIIIKKLTIDMAKEYVDFFDNRAFSDGNINKGCYCVWHHWTEEHEDERSQLPVEDRAFYKKKLAIKLIENDILHGFVAVDEDKIIGFCNADLKDNYFRFSRDNNKESWCGIGEGENVLALVCFIIAPEYRGRGISKLLLQYACEYANTHNYDFIESYPSEGAFNANNCCGTRSMYENQGFEIIKVNQGIISRKKCTK